MKPVLLCGKCLTETQWGDRFCGTCGEPIEWPETPTAGASSPGPTIVCSSCGTENLASEDVCVSCGVVLPGAGKREKRPAEPAKAKRESSGRRTAGPPTMSWKLLVGFVGFLVIGVIALELLTSRKVEGDGHVHPPVNQGASMQALRQIEELEQQLKVDPDNHQLVLRLANLLHDSRFYDKAIQHYLAYLDKHPDDADVRVDLGIGYFDTDRLEDAKQQMNAALKTNPKHVLAHFNMGIIYLREGDLQRANEWFRKTIALDPDGAAGQRAQRFLADHSNLQ